MPSAPEVESRFVDDLVRANELAPAAKRPKS